MTIHWETISDEQRQAIADLAPLVASGRLYLGGGTAAALQLGHRTSVDLDWFGRDAVDDPLQLAQDVEAATDRWKLTSVDRGTLHGRIGEVETTFLRYKYPQIGPHVAIDDPHCRLASLVDIAAMKLMAVSQRGAKRDFVDVYAIGLGGLSLGEMLQAYREKYRQAEVSRVLMGLTYFVDAEAQVLPKLLWDVRWEEVKRTLEQWVADVAARDEG